MTAPLSLPPHLSSAEIEQRYRRCPYGVERLHWQIIWLLDRGAHIPTVANQLGYAEDWMRRIVHWLSTRAPQGCGTAVGPIPGRPRWSTRPCAGSCRHAWRIRRQMAVSGRGQRWPPG